ncbi:two-component system response regulator [Clostridium thermobutyricum]|uniref:Stage 0 sporulation protein A homolog n=1 Tax=Clostridium thermobutyricum TaxID=29372 RepID=N9Y507_9CLOT|nr:response regulator transcription factor [Clostridium thermobutyricum]ENZ03259.1 two-component system response regulator [Clostridium thermobutyricum]
MKKVLVVEDDLKIRELIEEFLKAEGYFVRGASDGLEGYSVFREEEFDLVITDIMMPRMDGYALTNLIREESNVPIVMLTALNDEEDQIRAFDEKVDDFISKPFSFALLIKRVEAILRRCSREAGESSLLQFENITLNEDTYKALVDGEDIELTLKEFNILKLLILNFPTVLKREVLMDKIWGYDYYGDMRVIDAHIKNLRKKIKYDYIKTVKGVGYVLEK